MNVNNIYLYVTSAEVLLLNIDLELAAIPTKV